MKISKRGAWGIVAAVVLTAGAGVAGWKDAGSPVGVDLHWLMAYGSLGSSHSSTSDATYVGCYVTGEKDKGIVGRCQGKDAQNEAFDCKTTLFSPSRALAAESRLSVRWDPSNNCADVTTNVASEHPAKSTGAKTPKEVAYASSDMFVSGSFGSVYNSGDTTQYIGCKTKATISPNGATVTCSAKNTAGTTFSCSISTSAGGASIFEAARAIHDDSYLEITRSGSTCTKLLVRNDSRYAPKR